MIESVKIGLNKYVGEKRDNFLYIKVLSTL